MYARNQSSPGVKFGRKIAKIKPETVSIYRGDRDIAKTVFLMPTLILGLMGRHYPEIVTPQDVNNHKLTNLSSQYYFVGMSYSEELAKGRGSDNYLLIDPALFESSIIDVAATYDLNICMQMPARFAREKEVCALAVMFCSVKEIVVKGKAIANPFYIPHGDELKALYCEYIDLLRKKFNHAFADGEEKVALQVFTDNLLTAYQSCGENNPFNMAFAQLEKQFPEFFTFVFDSNDGLILEAPSLFDAQPTLGEKMKKIAGMLFSMHPHTQSISKVKGECITIHDDPYARFYE